MAQIIKLTESQLKNVVSTIVQKNLLNEDCWEGYKSVGGKIKNGKRVPNCVPIKEASSSAQQAAIAINMKEKGIKPKNESEREMYEAMEIDESKNCPTDAGKWAASKSAAETTLTNVLKRAKF